MAFLIDWIQPASGDVAEIDIPTSALRMLTRALAGPGQDGVIAPGVNLVTHRQAGAGWYVDIGPFIAIVAGDDVSDQGAYVITNTAAYTLDTPSAPGSGTRTHRLVAQVRDHRCNPSWPAGTYDWIPLMVADSGGGTVLPSSAADLASVSISSGQSNVQDSHITQTYRILRSLEAPQPEKTYGPWQKYQASAAPWNQTGSWVPFGAGAWPPVTFTVPPSGAVYVTVHAGVNSSGGGNTASVGFGISGADTAAPTFGRCVSGQSVAIRASNRSLVTGLTPGATDTCTAYWHANGGSCTDTNDGHLIVEAVQ